MVYDNSIEQRMAANIPQYRVALDSKISRNRYFISAYILSIGVGFVYYTLISSHRIQNPYLYYKNLVQYKAEPDFINNQVIFQSKTIENKLKNL